MEDAERKLEHYGVKYWTRSSLDWPLYFGGTFVFQS